MRHIKIFAIAIVAAGIVVAAAGAGKKDVTLSLVAYSTPKPVMAKIISDFQATPDGQGVSFTTSYGPSDESGEGRDSRPQGRRRLPLDR